MLLELLERGCNGTTCVVAVVLGQPFGGGFDYVDVVGHSSVIGSQSVDDRPERRVHLLELVEELSVFGVVVQVDELAVAQAADLELPERRVALQRLELLVQLLCCEPVEDGRRKPLDAREFAADVCVDGEQRLMEPAPAGGLRAVLEDGHRHAPGSCRADARCSATRSRTIGATSRMNAVSVSGSGGAASMKVLKPRSVAKCVKTSAQCSGGPTIAWSPSVAGA